MHVELCVKTERLLNNWRIYLGKQLCTRAEKTKNKKDQLPQISDSISVLEKDVPRQTSHFTTSIHSTAISVCLANEIAVSRALSVALSRELFFTRTDAQHTHPRTHLCHTQQQGRGGG